MIPATSLFPPRYRRFRKCWAGDCIPARSHPDSGRDCAGIRTRHRRNPDAGASGRDRDGGRCGRDDDGAIAAGIRCHRGRNLVPSRPESGRCQTPSDSRPNFNRNPAEIRPRSGHHASNRNRGRILAGILAAGGGRWVSHGPDPDKAESLVLDIESLTQTSKSCSANPKMLESHPWQISLIYQKEEIEG
ncbi:hypothetical protein ZIOFF_022580 [Zingiber officinale]|uniref:Uncharacterized protein n=1 Tax=Zingiber officinale TaxID=94328 RepID=A0A8J5L9B4_ZINOF|nr:hypothetical protein ZIOFF_022580 [Zingiber officinale]